MFKNVKDLQSHLRVIGTERWNRVMTVLGYRDSLHSPGTCT